MRSMAIVYAGGQGHTLGPLHWPARNTDSPDLTLTINRADLEEAMIGTTPLQQQIADGTATLEGAPLGDTSGGWP